MNNIESFRSRLKANGWSELPDPGGVHFNTRDGNLIKGADAYLILHPQPTFQLGLLLFEAKGQLRLRLYDIVKGSFNWLQIEYGKNLEALLTEIISVQNELPSTSYLSLMGGTFSPEFRVSLMAWEQF